jgi:hypothetical protein
VPLMPWIATPKTEAMMWPEYCMMGVLHKEKPQPARTDWGHTLTRDAT